MLWNVSIFVALSVLPITALASEIPKLSDHITSNIQIENLGSSGLGISSTDLGQLLPLALDLIKDFEQWSPIPYNDAAGYCTIGYGHLVARNNCRNAVADLKPYEQPLSLQAGETLLNGDTGLAKLAINTYVISKLSDEQYGALVSFVFNVGAGAFSKSTLLKFVNNEEFDLAAAQFPRWVIAGGKISDGLINRRSCERALFNGSLTYGQDKRFHRDDCEGLGATTGTESLIDITTGETP